jgi:hypothetical protein
MFDDLSNIKLSNDRRVDSQRDSPQQRCRDSSIRNGCEDPKYFCAPFPARLSDLEWKNP